MTDDQLLREAERKEQMALELRKRAANPPVQADPRWQNAQRLSGLEQANLLEREAAELRTEWQKRQTKVTLTVIDGLVVSVKPELDGYGQAVVEANEGLHSVLRKIDKFGWKPDGEIPKVFQPGQTYTINVLKN
jgi:hypothetical protein